MLTDTAFDVVSVVSVNVSDVLVKVTVGAVDEQARRDMLGIGTQLEVVATRRLCRYCSDRDRNADFRTSETWLKAPAIDTLKSWTSPA